MDNRRMQMDFKKDTMETCWHRSFILNYPALSFHPFRNIRLHVKSFYYSTGIPVRGLIRYFD